MAAEIDGRYYYEDIRDEMIAVIFDGKPFYAVYSTNPTPYDGEDDYPDPVPIAPNALGGAVNLSAEALRHVEIEPGQSDNIVAVKLGKRACISAVDPEGNRQAATVSVLYSEPAHFLQLLGEVRTAQLRPEDEVVENLETDEEFSESKWFLVGLDAIQCSTAVDGALHFTDAAESKWLLDVLRSGEPLSD